MNQKLNDALSEISNQHIPDGPMSQDSLNALNDCKFYKSCRAVFRIIAFPTFSSFQSNLLEKDSNWSISIKEIENGIELSASPKFGEGSHKPFVYFLKADKVNENIGTYSIRYDGNRPGQEVDTLYRIPAYYWDGEGLGTHLDMEFQNYPFANLKK